jgi:NAD(P)H-dependent FMN reductase
LHPLRVANPRSGRGTKFANNVEMHRAASRSRVRPCHSAGFVRILTAMLALIVGTNRPGSNTRKVAALIEGIYSSMGVTPRVLDLAQLPPKIFSPGSYAEKPKSFEPFSRGVLDAAGLVVVTPEYNGSVPGVLKYFIDMLEFPASFERRPVCFVGLAAGIWGALRPVEQLQAIFGYRNAFIYPERVFLPGVGNLLDAEGRLKNPELTGRLRAQAAGFIEFVERLKGVKLRSR